VLYVRDPATSLHDPRVQAPDHPDSPERITAIDRALAASGLPPMRTIDAPLATEAELCLVHSEEHVETIRDRCLSGGGQIDADTFLCPSSYEAALHAAGGAGAMVRAVASYGARSGFAALRPPGHHADRDRAMGFCLFNNVAVAAQLAISELGCGRVMIVDWDVHHGNGTAEIFRRRADVLVTGIHQHGLYPGTGALTDTGSGPGRGYTVNIPVPRGSDEEVWVSVLEYVIMPIGQEFDPDLILISAGYDAHRDDPLGGCWLEADSFGAMTCHVRDLAESVGAPVGAVLEGGYDPDALGASVVATIAALGGEGEAVSIAPEQIVTPRAASHFAQRWRL
jgi:acetoin utilization deacetylase AcuC-like enzyme